MTARHRLRSTPWEASWSFVITFLCISLSINIFTCTPEKHRKGPSANHHYHHCPRSSAALTEIYYPRFVISVGECNIHYNNKITFMRQLWTLTADLKNRSIIRTLLAVSQNTHPDTQTSSHSMCFHFSQKKCLGFGFCCRMHICHSFPPL
jgi:hypothetical protein